MIRVSFTPPQEAILGLGSKVVNNIWPFLYPCDGGREQPLERGNIALLNWPSPPVMKATVTSLLASRRGPVKKCLSNTKRDKKFLSFSEYIKKIATLMNLLVVFPPM